MHGESPRILFHHVPPLEPCATGGPIRTRQTAKRRFLHRLLPGCARQTTGNSSRPQVDFVRAGGGNWVAVGNVSELQPSSGSLIGRRRRQPCPRPRRGPARRLARNARDDVPAPSFQRPSGGSLLASKPTEGLPVVPPEHRIDCGVDRCRANIGSVAIMQPPSANCELVAPTFDGNRFCWTECPISGGRHRNGVGSTISPRAAALHSRAARFTLSPMTVKSIRSTDPTVPEMTSPV